MATPEWPELDGVPVGYYAIYDPDDQTTVIYWRRILTDKSNGLKAWPSKAWYGPPLPRRSEIPTDRAERDAFAAAWRKTRQAYIDRVVAALAADPIAAGRRFAEFGIRCCICGRALRDALSKSYGIGPECRSGIPALTLARYLTPLVGQAHAVQLAEQPGEEG
ncbi:DUF6011 domain-containing protein [Streptomyces sp. NPDC001552]|uniref:DUF6011 domain-containing protein n=1 Tax=Streptomyces sp. NPDC001552 TaxID=3364587 RepID=UPI0036902E81